VARLWHRAVAERDAVSTALLGVAGDSADERALAEQVCRACVVGLDIDGASMSVLTASVARVTLWSSDATASLLEELQFSLGEGPCMQAATTGRAVMVADVNDSPEAAGWPAFTAAVLERSAARALFVVPLQWGVINLGVLDLYRVAPGGLSQDQCRDVIAAANLAALMMLELRTDPDDALGLHDSDAPWLDPELGSHTAIHQATGMVIAQLNIHATDALARLRAHAFSHHRLLLEVAADVVARRLIFTDEMR
jgi:hypothetical protein